MNVRTLPQYIFQNAFDQLAMYSEFLQQKLKLPVFLKSEKIWLSIKNLKKINPKLRNKNAIQNMRVVNNPYSNKVTEGC